MTFSRTCLFAFLLVLCPVLAAQNLNAQRGYTSDYSDPTTCSPARSPLHWNMTENVLKRCSAENTWSAISGTPIARQAAPREAGSIVVMLKDGSLAAVPNFTVDPAGNALFNFSLNGNNGQVPSLNGLGGFGNPVTPSRCLTVDCGLTSNLTGPPLKPAFIPATVNGLGIPSANLPTISGAATCSGTCATTWTYIPVALSGPYGALQAPGSALTLTNATSLSATNYNTMTLACSDSNTASIAVWRTTPSGQKGRLGFALCGGTLVDNGISLDGTDPPSDNTGILAVGKYQSIAGVTLANIPATAGTFTWCTNCNVASPCTTGGSGAWAFVNAAGDKNCPF